MRHGNAILGAVLGALAHAEAVDEVVKFPEEPVPARMARAPKKESRVQQSMKGKKNEELESPANDPLAGNLRVAGGSERSRGALAPENAR